MFSSKKNQTRPVWRLRTTQIIAAAALLVFAGCGDHDHDNDHENHGHSNGAHGDLGSVQIETRGDLSATLAIWDFEEGWSDADGNPIDTLPNPVDTAGDLHEFYAGGPRASLSVRFFDPDGEEFEMGTVQRFRETTDERICTEDSARFAPLDEDTDVILWDRMVHPDTELNSPAATWAEQSDGTLVNLQHCNHIHIYPKAEGTVEIEFLLWHVDHSDDGTDPISIVVGPAPED